MEIAVLRKVEHTIGGKKKTHPMDLSCSFYLVQITKIKPGKDK